MSPNVALIVFWTIGVFSVLRPADACLSSGCCGPPPAPPACNCGPGYACGSYGCYRVRNRAAVASVRTAEFGTNGEKEGRRGAVAGIGLLPTINVGNSGRRTSPDDVFLRCCEERNLPDACLQKCAFSAYSKDALTRMYFKQDPCPIQAAAEMQFCAAQGRDHRNCCGRRGVAATAAGPKCLIFCDQTPGHVQQLDMSYLSCYDRFEDMKQCFWDDLVRTLRSTQPPSSSQQEQPPSSDVQLDEENRQAVISSQQALPQPIQPVLVVRNSQPSLPVRLSSTPIDANLTAAIPPRVQPEGPEAPLSELPPVFF